MTAQSRPVVGTITDADTGQPIAGAVVSDGQDSSTVIVGGDKKYIYAISDAQGHYRLDGLVADSPEEVIVYPPASTPYLPVGEKVTVQLNAPQLKLDFQLHKGIWVRGRVIDQRTGLPVPSAVEYLANTDDPQIKIAFPGLFRGGLMPIFYERRTDGEGRFAIAVPPCRGVLALRADDFTGFRRGVGEEALNFALQRWSEWQTLQLEAEGVFLRQLPFRARNRTAGQFGSAGN